MKAVLVPPGEIIKGVQSMNGEHERLRAILTLLAIYVGVALAIWIIVVSYGEL